MKPLPHDVDLDLETWLSETSYPEWRKDELRKAFNECDDVLHPRHSRVNTHMKCETYPTYKHARPINSRTDVFKCLVGPLFKAIEKEMYKHPSFIKHISVADRPNYIFNKLYRAGGRYAATDYTSFEALFTEELMSCCEFELYHYMIKDVVNRSYYEELLNRLLGQNTCKFKWWSLFVRATRMSGEMCTSLGNGFSNLMFFLFVCQENGCTNVDGVVEGDDGLFVYVGQDPSPEDFERLGLKIKLEIHTVLNTASFCGIIFDERDLVNLRDPIQVLINFGWGDGRYSNCRSSKLKKLLRCKALSFAHQYPGCPVIDAMSKCFIRLTRNVDIRKFIMKDRTMGQWEREKLLELVECDDKRNPLWERDVPFREVGLGSRLIVEQKFGLCIEDQLSIERMFNEKTDLCPVDSSLLRSIIPSLNFNHYDTYAHDFLRLTDDIYRTGRNWCRMSGFEVEFDFEYDQNSIPSR